MNQIRKQRQAAGMTQVELAASVGVSQAAVVCWESEKDVDPTWDKAPAIARALGCPLSALFVMPDGEEPELRSTVSSFDPDLDAVED